MNNINFNAEIPHINVLTKADILEAKQRKGKFIDKYVQFAKLNRISDYTQIFGLRYFNSY